MMYPGRLARQLTTVIAGSRYTTIAPLLERCYLRELSVMPPRLKGSPYGSKLGNANDGSEKLDLNDSNVLGDTVSQTALQLAVCIESLSSLAPSLLGLAPRTFASIGQNRACRRPLG
jgi:hypothetical protein